jgi:putative RNA 2'-phosphotransferase
MLRECRTHGYFRDHVCPSCSAEGRFLMNDREVEQIGRTMAGVLRHFPERFSLKMNEHGWVDLMDFVTALQIRQNKFRWIRMHHIMAIIETDPKGRYEFKDGSIRATYGHSINVDLDLSTENIPSILYYPTTKEEVNILLETGLKPSDRKMVHLSGSYEIATEAGKVRVSDPVILKIDAKKAITKGFVIKKAGKSIFLTEAVPHQFISMERESGKE